MDRCPLQGEWKEKMKNLKKGVDNGGMIWYIN